MAIKTRLEDMVIGDKISAMWFSRNESLDPNNHFERLAQTGTFTTAVAFNSVVSCRFYFIYVGNDFKGRMLLIADRNVAHSISWDQLNTMGYATKDGVEITSLGLDPTKWKTNIRLLKGGVSDALKANSEWDKYIVNGPVGSDNTTWNWTSIYSWTSTTDASNSLWRVLRGNTSVSVFSNNASSLQLTNYGFRPVLVAESLSTPEPITNKYLIQDEGKLKSFLNNTWSEVGQSPATEEQFTASGMDEINEIPSTAWSQLSNTFSVLEYTNTKENIATSLNITYDDKSQVKRTANLTAVPHPQLLVPTGDITVGELESVKIAGSGESLKIIASSDSGTTWKGKSAVALNDLAGIKSNGWTIEEVNAFTKEQLDSLFPNGKVRLAFYLEKDKVTDTLEIQSVSVNEMEYKAAPSVQGLSVLYEALSADKPQFYVSRDGGANWTEADIEQLMKLDSLPEGKDLQVKAVLKGGQELHGISFSWI